MNIKDIKVEKKLHELEGNTFKLISLLVSKGIISEEDSEWIFKR